MLAFPEDEPDYHLFRCFLSQFLSKSGVELSPKLYEGTTALLLSPYRGNYDAEALDEQSFLWISVKKLIDQRNGDQ